VINLLCFADDTVLLAPAWSALQSLIDTLYILANKINMKFNDKKIVCMILTPTVSRKYLGNIVTKDLHDDVDIEREMKCLYTRCMFISRFKYC